MTEYSYSELSNTVILLVSGKAGVGKTLSCQMMAEIADNQGYIDCTVKSFATELKWIARYTFGWDTTKDEKGRKLLQDLGRVARDYNINFWAVQLLKDVYNHPVFFDFVFVDDWRFPNEERFLEDESDFIIKTLRIDSPERESLKGTEAYSDISETALSSKKEDYDYYIENTGTLKDLNKKLSVILVDIKNSLED